MDRAYPSIYTKAAAVTKSDSDTSGNLYRGLFIGTGGNLVVVPAEGTSANLTFQNVPSGTLLAIAVKMVNSTNNTCSGIIGLS